MIPWSSEEKKSYLQKSVIRVVTAGDVMSGKTSLTRSLISGSQCRTMEVERTIVAELRQIEAEGQVISVVDMGGHPSYQYTAMFFLVDHPTTLVLLCHKAQDDLKKTFNWLMSILTRAPNCHVIPVITQIDLLGEDHAVGDYKKAFVKGLQDLILIEIESTNTKRALKGHADNSRLNTIVQKYQDLIGKLPELVYCTSVELSQTYTVDKLRSELIKYGHKMKQESALDENTTEILYGNWNDRNF